MKKALVIICLLCLAQASYAARDRNYFEYDLTPSGTYQEDSKPDVTTTTTTVKSETSEVKEEQTTKKTKKRRRFTGQGANPANTYWDFGRPNYGYSGEVQ